MTGKFFGHKTFSNGRGGFRHEPLTEAEAAALWEAAESAKARRAEAMPTAEDCARIIAEACVRLAELGWTSADYPPPANELVHAISAGSSGIHDAYCEPRPAPPEGFAGKWWWAPADGDLWPHCPIYWKAKT